MFYICEVGQESLYGVIAFDKVSQRKKVKHEGFKKPGREERMTPIAGTYDDVKERKKILKH